jgi:hypothetical protein
MVRKKLTRDFDVNAGDSSMGSSQNVAMLTRRPGSQTMR